MRTFSSLRNFNISSGRRAFTVVELAVVITVIGILAAVAYVGYSAWRDRVAETELRSDLAGVAAAMESNSNWGKGYPELADGAVFDGGDSTKSIFTQSEHVLLTYYEGDDKSFCIDATSKSGSSVAMFYDSKSSSKEPVKGTCLGGEGYVPNSAHTILVYDTRLSGCSGTVQLPITQPTSAPGSTISWGDGQTGALTSGLQSHTYDTPGRYMVTYDGPINIVNSGSVAVNNRGCLKEVRQWGNGAAPTAVAFFNSTNLSYLAEPPHSVTDMSRMFCYIPGFNQDISHWDVSKVTNMQNMFRGTAFNQPLNSWNVGNVTNMSEMFMDAKSFNQPIDNWNMQKVYTINQMFYGADKFNQPLNNWNTGSIVIMSYVFSYATSFNQPLNNWDTSNAITFEGMFRGAFAFNGAVNNWNTSKVTNMQRVFDNAYAFNQPVDGWDMSNATDTSWMFVGSPFNQPLNGWNISNVTNLAGMFYGAKDFNQPLDSWNTSKVTNMASLFWGAEAFNQPLNAWNVSNVQYFQNTFFMARSFNQPLNNWNTANALSMAMMFAGTDVFNQPLNNWNTSKVTDMSAMFQHALSFNQNLSGWNVSQVANKPPNHFSLGASAWTLPKPIW